MSCGCQVEGWRELSPEPSITRMEDWSSAPDSEQGPHGLGLQGLVGPVCCFTLPSNCLFIPVSPLEVNSSGAELAQSAPSC